MPITISSVIDDIHRKKYLLPSIQREFVWDQDKMVLLFDSLMREFPIGTFLFWRVEKNRARDFQFYEFITRFHERDFTHNPKADLTGEDSVTAVLDGQQRLTSLYLGFRGSIAYKLPRRRWDDDSAFPNRKLYVNLLSRADSEEMLYDFRFLTDEEAEIRNGRTFWFKVGEILDLREESSVNDFLVDHELSKLDGFKFANKLLFRMHSMVHKDKVINFFLEREQELDKVLHIFIRVNSGGTPLSYSDLLLSIASAQWVDIDARDAINGFVDEINEVGNTFEFNKDFVLKTSLVLSDIANIAFKVDNFNKTNMHDIERNWQNITTAVRDSVQLVSEFGYDRYTLASNYTIIPVAYYLLKAGLPDGFNEKSKYLEDRKSIRRFILRAILSRIFGGQPDSVLRSIRAVIQEHNNGFPIDRIVKEFSGKPKNLDFSEQAIMNLLDYEYGSSYVFSVLALLYPNLDFKNKFHIDHIFPKSLFTERKLRKEGISEDKMEFYIESFNRIPNLQLLEGTLNREKMAQLPEDWLKDRFSYHPDERDDYRRKNYIPDMDLDLASFPEFIEKREKALQRKLQDMLA